MRGILLALVFAAAGFAQNPGTFTITQTDPTGNGCGSNSVLLKTPDGSIYTCQNGAYAKVSGGAATSVPFSGVTPGTNTGPLGVGTGGSLSVSGSGSIQATDISKLATGLAACTVTATSGTITLHGNGTGTVGGTPCQDFTVGPLTGTATIATSGDLITGLLRVTIINGASAQSLTLPGSFVGAAAIPPDASANLVLFGAWTGTAMNYPSPTVSGVGYSSLLNVCGAATPGVGFVRNGIDNTGLSYATLDSNGACHLTPIVITASANNFLTGLGTNSVFTKAQPAFSNLSGSATCAQEPALVGDVTSSAGTCTTVATVTNAGNIDLATQAAAQSSIAFFTPAITGKYNIEWNAKITQIATGSSILGGTTGFSATYTHGDDSTSQTMTTPEFAQNGGSVAVGSGLVSNATTGFLSGYGQIYAKSGSAVTVSFGYTSVGATPMQYAFHASAILAK